MRRYEDFWRDYWQSSFPRLTNLTWPAASTRFRGSFMIARCFTTWRSSCGGKPNQSLTRCRIPEVSASSGRRITAIGARTRSPENAELREPGHEAVAIFYGIAAIWERDLGVLNRYLVSPAPRSALVIGKALSASMRGLSQAVVIYLRAAIMGVDLSLDPRNMVMVVLLIALGSGLFSTFSLIIACIVMTRERFMGIGQVLTMPIFFASNTIYPLSLMPPWLKAVSTLNPLSYEVDALRGLLIGTASNLWLDTGVLLFSAVAGIAVASSLLRRLARG